MGSGRRGISGCTGQQIFVLLHDILTVSYACLMSFH